MRKIWRVLKDNIPEMMFIYGMVLLVDYEGAFTWETLGLAIAAVGIEKMIDKRIEMKK